MNWPCRKFQGILVLTDKPDIDTGQFIDTNNLFCLFIILTITYVNNSNQVYTH